MVVLYLFLSFLISCMIARIIIPKISLISKKKGLFDIPNKRKLHTAAIPRLGGVSFFPTITFSMAFTLALRYLYSFYIPEVIAEHVIPEFLFLICGLTILYLIGIADDLVGVRYKKKFLVQFLVAAFFPISGIYINNFYGLLGLHEISFWLGMPITMLLVVFITNAINLIDGLDGLASSLSSVALIIFGFLFFAQKLWIYSMLSFAVVGVLLPFFYYNVFGRTENSTKIFMGDTGSLTLGYILSFLSIKYAMYNPAISQFTEGAILISFIILIVPMFDVIRVILVRTREHKNPFKPDQNHIHHKFLAMGISHRKTMFSILGIACLFAISNIILISYVNINILFFADILIWIFMNLIFDIIRNRHQLNLKK